VVNDRRRPAAQPERSRSGSAARASTPLPATPTSVAPSPSTPGEVQDVRTLDGQILQSGAYAGRTYADVYFNEMNCRKSMVGKLMEVEEWLIEQSAHHQLCQVLCSTA